MACRLIYNRQGVEVESKTWNQILQEVEGDETIADRLYGQLASPNFLAWFGDYIDNPDLASVMTNELGEPRLLYHASTKKFNNFDLAFSKEVGFHFGTEQSAIERHFPGGLSGISLSSKIKPGVNQIFKEYSELAKIGTEQQYSQYLDTIFPDSVINDIVWNFGEKDKTLRDKTFYHTDRGYSREIGSTYTDFDSGISRAVLINSKNPTQLKEVNFDSVENAGNYEVIIGEDTGQSALGADPGSYSVVTSNLNQILELGSKQDIEGFKNWIENGSDKLQIKLKEARQNLQTEIGDFTVYPVFLNVRNMVEGVDYLEADDTVGTILIPKEEYDYLVNLNVGNSFGEEFIKLAIAFYQKGSISRDQIEKIFSKDLTLQEALGNPDGYYYTNLLENKGETSYVVFDPKNIKSVYNNGQYGLKTENMYENLSFLKSNKKFSNIPQAVLSKLTKNGTVSALNANEKFVNEDRWYFQQRGKEERGRQWGLDVSQRMYHVYMSMNNLNRDMFTEGISKNGIPYIKPNENFNLVDSIDENTELIKKDKLDAIIDFFSSKFGITKDRIVYTTKKAFKEQFPQEYSSNSNSAYKDGKFYFFTRNVTTDIAVEELLHPFAYTVKTLNPQLFNNLLKEAQKSYPKLHQKIQALYKDKTQSNRDEELVTQALSRVFNNVYENEEPKSFIDIVKDFVSWIREVLNQVLAEYGTGKIINVPIEKLHPNMQLQDIANVLNSTDAHFDIIFPEGTMMNRGETKLHNFNDVITTLLQDNRVYGRVNEIFRKLPESLKEAKKELTLAINEKDREKLQTAIRDMEELDLEENQDIVKQQLKGIITTVQIYNHIYEQVDAIANDTTLDNNLKLSYYISALHSAQALDSFSDIITSLHNELKSNLKEISNPQIFGNIKNSEKQVEYFKEFIRLLETAKNIERGISSKISDLVVSPLLDELVASNEYSYAPELIDINIEIKKISDKISGTLSQPEKNKLQVQIGLLKKRKDKILEFAPTRENLKKVFDGEFKDANKISLWLESFIINGHPLVNTLQNIINDMYDRVGGNLVNSKNEAQTNSDLFSAGTGRNLRSMEDYYEDIGDDLIRIPKNIKFKEGTEELDLDKNGNIQFDYVEQNTLYQQIDNEYYSKYMELEKIKNYYKDLHVKNKSEHKVDKDIKNKYDQAFKDFEEFKKLNSQREYSPEYYEHMESQDVKIGDKTVREITKNIYEEIERERDMLDRGTTDQRLEHIENIKLLNVELKKLRSLYYDDGTKKSGDDLQIANILNEYNKTKFEIGSYVPTAEGEERYRVDLAIITNKKYPQELIDNGMADKLIKIELSKIQQKNIIPEYFEALADISESINTLNNQLVDNAKNDIINTYLDKETLTLEKKDIYTELRDITKPYRDEDQIIDGILLSAQNPALVKRVKKLQQYLEDLKFKTTKITGLSPEEKTELKTLKEGSGERYIFLIKKKNDFKAFKLKNNELINSLNALYKELANISESSSTSYYEEQKDIIINSIKNDEEVIAQARTFVAEETTFVKGGVKYRKENSKWYTVQKVGKKEVLEPIFDKNDPLDTGNQEIVDMMVGFIAELDFKNSDWYKDNHYVRYVYNEKKKDYIPKDFPIYIWEKQEPTNPNFIKISPAKEYNKYVINDEHINKQFQTSYKGIPIAKPGKFENKKYNKIISDPVKARFLNYLSTKYLDLQTPLTKGQRMGHVLPAVAKTEGENRVNMTNKVLAFDGTFTQILKDNLLQPEDEDTSYLTGGGQRKSNKVPIRFIGTMDTKRQTKNALASILLFEYHMALNVELNNKLPIFEASKLLASQVSVLETKNSMDKLGIFSKIGNLINPKQSKQEIIGVKNVEKSILSKTIDSMMDIHIFGQRLKATPVNMGPIGTVDLSRAANNLNSFAAKYLFAGAVIPATYNSVATRIQLLVNSGVKSKLYSFKNIKNAQAKVLKYGADLMKDYTKLGNKSLIGQVLEKYQVFAENPGKAITSKAEFFWTKEAMEIIGSPKQMSEDEVLILQFMTIADATIIKKDGKDIKLSNIEDIFEIKDGKLQTKPGIEITKQQEQIFRNKFQSMARKIAGAYRLTELSKAETEAIGKSAFFLRRFLPAMIRNRFGGEGWNSQEMEVQIGFHRETFNNLIELFTKYKFNVSKYWENLDDKERVNHYKFLLEYGAMFLMLGLLSLAGGDDNKKELKDNSWLYNIGLITLYRAEKEMEQFTIKGSDELIRIGKNPFILFNTLGNISKTIGLIYPTVMGDEKAFYQQNTGLHEKGDSKFIFNFFKLYGYTGNTFKPEEYFVNLRSAQNR